MSDRIYPHEAMQELGGICMRTLKKWCALNHVAMLCDAGSRKQYLMLEEFENAKTKEPKKYFSTQYDTNKKSVRLSSKEKIYREVKYSKQYEPKGKSEIAFLQALAEKLGRI